MPISFHDAIAQAYDLHIEGKDWVSNLLIPMHLLFGGHLSPDCVPSVDQARGGAGFSTSRRQSDETLFLDCVLELLWDCTFAANNGRYGMVSIIAKRRKCP